MKTLRRFAVLLMVVILGVLSVFFVGCGEDGNVDDGDDTSVKYGIKIYYKIDDEEPILALTDSYTVQQGYSLQTPELNGYDFLYWTGDKFKGNRLKYQVQAGEDGDRTFTAHFKKVPNNFNLVINRMLDDGFSAGTIHIKYDQTKNFTLPVSNNHIGYEFIGWEGVGIDGVNKNYTIPANTHGIQIYRANYAKMPDYTVQFSDVPVWEESVKVENRVDKVTLTGVLEVKVPYNHFLEVSPIVSGYGTQVKFGEWRFPDYSYGNKADENPFTQKKFYFTTANFEKGSTIVLRPFIYDLYPSQNPSA